MKNRYDKKDKKDIIRYAKLTKGKKISDIIGNEKKYNSKDKGKIGNLIQSEYFGISRNTSSKADFEDVNMELKCFAYCNKRDNITADQRLSLSKINYMEFDKKVLFEESHVYQKCKSMLWLIYLLEKNQKRIDSTIKYIRLYEFEKIVKQDFKQIKKDYYTIIDKIRKGRANQLSEGDTEYLGAARTGDKGSKLERTPKNGEALPRRFALKKSYMTYLMNEYVVKERDFSNKILKPKTKFQIKITRGKTFEEWLDKIDNSYLERTAQQILKRKSIKEIIGTANLTDKNIYNRIGLAMLGIKSNKDLYLQKTNTVVKSVRISKTKIIKEDWSFPVFSISTMLSQDWEESEVFTYLSEQRILMQIFVEQEEKYVYKGHLFLKFTPEELDKGVKDTWEKFKKKVKDGLTFEVKKQNSKIQICSNIDGKVEGQIGYIKSHAGGVTYDIDRTNISISDDIDGINIFTGNIQNGRFIWKSENKEKYGDNLPNGDIITKQSFWLNREYILEYIKKNKPEIFSV